LENISEVWKILITDEFHLVSIIAPYGLWEHILKKMAED